MAPFNKKTPAKSGKASKVNAEDAQMIQAKIVEETPPAVSKSYDLTLQILEWREKRADFVSEMAAIIEECKRLHYPMERPRVTQQEL